jgi:predicted HTH domain antitoxin
MSSHLLKLELPVNLSTDEVRLLLALKLYESDKLSLGQAAEMAGFSKRSFLEVLGRNQIPIFRYSPEDLRRELEA